MELGGASALISGGASGMGAATARHLAARGVRVTLIDLHADAVEAVAAEVGGLGLACDVSDAAALESAIATARERHGPARLCVSCAGIAPAQRIVGREGPMPLEAFDRVIGVNLVGTFNMMRLAAADMADLEPEGPSGERGVIVNTASVAAYDGQIGQAAYSASKGGVVALTLPAARELARFGVRVMTIAPGLMRTPMLLGMPEEIQEALAAQVPFPRRLGNPEEFARLVEHIAGNEMLNGEVIRLDGAIRMQPK